MVSSGEFCWDLEPGGGQEKPREARKGQDGPGSGSNSSSSGSSVSGSPGDSKHFDMFWLELQGTGGSPGDSNELRSCGKNLHLITPSWHNR